MIDVEKYRKPASSIDPAIIHRWSPRSFQEKSVPDSVLWSLFEAARWAPSAYNLQPWRFIIARTKEDREKFLSFISERNASWCRKAPVLAVILSKTDCEMGYNRSHAFDTGAAWGYLSLEAVKKGLMTHPMSGFDAEKARKVLNVPPEYELHAVVAIGYQGKKEDLPEEFQEREKPSDRRPLEESLFEGAFGQSVK